jgi:hypothetical protein
MGGFWLMGWLCSGLYVVVLVHFLANAAWLRFRHASTRARSRLRPHIDFLRGVSPIAGPTTGYLAGTAVTLLPGLSGLVLAPLYGTLLGAILTITLPRLAGSVRYVYPNMLQNEAVQHELQLTDVQLEKVTEVLREIEDYMPYPNYSLGPEALRESMEELRRKQTEATDRALACILQPEQMLRYKQLQLQDQGILAIADRTVQTSLKLDEGQREMITKIVASAHRLLDEILRSATWRHRWAMKQARVVRCQESMKKVFALLTEEQKQMWREMTGEPFKFA